MKLGSAPVRGVLLCSGGLATIAILTASGVTPLADSEVSTEFVDFSWWMAGFLVFLPVGISSYLKPDAVGPILLVALLPQIALPTVLVARSVATKWGDGTEFFGYLYPVLMGLLFSLAAAVGSRIRFHRDKFTPRNADEPERPETSRLAS